MQIHLESFAFCGPFSILAGSAIHSLRLSGSVFLVSFLERHGIMANRLETGEVALYEITGSFAKQRHGQVLINGTDAQHKSLRILKHFMLSFLRTILTEGLYL